MKRRQFLKAAALAGTATVLGCSKEDEKRQKQKVNGQPLADFDDKQLLDYCIIGSGPAGCTIAEQLLSKGKKVTLLESGLDLFNDSDASSHSIKLDTYSNSGNIKYPLYSSRIRALGGTSNIWTGRCPRLLPSDFAGNPLSPEDGWPISYEELKPYYQEAEKKLFVRGEKLTASHAPRELPLPFYKEAKIAKLRETLGPLNIQIDPPPVSIDNTNSTRRFIDLIIELQEDPNFTLFKGATATSFGTDNKGTVTDVKVKYFSPNSTAIKTKTIKARQYIIACGALESTRLLYLSRNEHFPNGIGNHSDKLGCYFMEHPFVSYISDIKPAHKPPHWMMGRTYQFTEEFNRKGLGDVLAGFYASPAALKIALGIEMSPEATNRITLSPDKKDIFGNPGLDLDFSFSDRDRNSFAACDTLASSIFKQLGYDDFTKESNLHWSHHHIGSTRMSNKAADGVVDKNLCVHGTNNLHVASSSTFVTSGAANPTLTITALSLKLAEHLLQLNS